MTAKEQTGILDDINGYCKKLFFTAAIPEMCQTDGTPKQIEYLVLCQVLGQIKRGLFVLIQPGPDPSSTIVSDRQSHIDSVIGNRNDCGSEPCCKMC